MSNFNKFMKQNKVKKENTTFPATKSLKDENGEPLLWVIKPVSTKENDIIVDDCTIEVPMKNNPNRFIPKIKQSKYVAKLVCAAVVEPNLNDKALQDSYGVMTPEELVKEMIDDPMEFDEFAKFIQSYNGLQKPLSEKVEEAKN